MKHLTSAALTLALALVLAVPAFAHGNNVHVRGVVTQVSATAITVQQADSTAKTVTLSAKTTFLRAGKAAAPTDVKIGDRVVIDLPKGSNEALEIQIGTAPAKAAPAK